MLRRHFAVILLAAAAAACSDTPTQSVALTPTPEAPALKTFQGTLVAGSLLRSKEGRLISLAGWQTYLFGTLLGADVHIEGTATNDLEEGIYINDFILLTLDGFPVMDGVLGAREEGYFIRARTGHLSELSDVPAGLVSYLGRRVFVAHSGNATIRFGLLELDEGR